MKRAHHPPNSLRQAPALWVRLAVMLLAAVQVIAPSWHVCEMGGNSCCQPNTGNGNFICVLHLRAATSAPCNRCKPHAGSSLDANHVVTFQGECLAQLLQSMPASLLATPAMTRLRLSYARFAATAPIAPRRTPLRRTPSRGPPSSFNA